MVKYRAKWEEAKLELDKLRKQQIDPNLKRIASLLEKAAEKGRDVTEVLLYIALAKISKDAGYHPLFGMIGLRLATAPNQISGAAGLAMLTLVGLGYVSEPAINNPEVIEDSRNKWDAMSCQQKRVYANMLRWQMVGINLEEWDFIEGWYDPKMWGQQKGEKYIECVKGHKEETAGAPTGYYQCVPCSQLGITNWYNTEAELESHISIVHPEWETERFQP